MPKSVMVILAFMFSLGLLAQNQMPLVNTLTNSIPNSYFGQQLAVLDFNNDGFDDLFVFSYSDSQYSDANVYVYYGGTVMDTIPDLFYTIPYDYPGNAEVILNAGDVNGDGHEDFVIREDVEGGYTNSRLKFFYGGTNPDMVGDQVVVYPNAVDGENGVQPIECIGDVNHDGCDDLGLMLCNNSGIRRLSILLGGSFETVTVVDSITSSRKCLVTRVGDMSGDGIDDFMVGYTPRQNTQPEFPRYQYFYYGSNPLNLNNRILMMESYVANQTDTNGYGIGDFNGDGYDDCIYYFRPTEDIGYRKIKMGSTTLPESEELTIEHSSYLIMNTTFLAYGDFNADGYSDVASGNSAAYISQGIGEIFLGKANPNGTPDLVINHPATSPYHQFGWAVETGDFNGDGYCDAVYSAPNSDWGQPQYPGYVYIYAGNAQLADTTVANEDEVAVPPAQTSLTIYPNPTRNQEVELHFKLEALAKGTLTSPVLCLYNIKGQLVSRRILTPDEADSGTGILYTGKLKCGIYIATLNDKDKRISTAKVAVK